MKKANEIYNTYETWWYDYQPMLNEFGEIILQIDEQGYQGDSFVIYRDNNRYGYLTFGWGSCSGCDALQGCNSIDEVQDLMNDLYDSIIWFDSLSELKSYFENKDWTLCHEWYIDEFKEFIRNVKILS